MLPLVQGSRPVDSQTTEPKLETAVSVINDTNQYLQRAKALLFEMDARIEGPGPAQADKEAGCGPGLLAQAFAARSQAQQIVQCLEIILQKL